MPWLLVQRGEHQYRALGRQWDHSHTGWEPGHLHPAGWSWQMSLQLPLQMLVGFSLVRVCWSPQGWRQRPRPLRGEPPAPPHPRGLRGVLSAPPAWVGGPAASGRAVPGRALAGAGTAGCRVPCLFRKGGGAGNMPASLFSVPHTEPAWPSGNLHPRAAGICSESKQWDPQRQQCPIVL